MMIADKLPEIIRTQVEAIKNIKFDNITVWDTGGGEGGDAGSSTSNWLTNLLKSVPPMDDAFKMVGQNMPGFLEGNADMVKMLEEKAKEKSKKSEEIKKQN